MEDKTVAGILWWKPSQWEKAKKLSSDSHLFDDNYQEWKKGAETTLINFRVHGRKVYKVEIDLDELIRWCKDQKIPFDRNARSKFVSIKVQKLHEEKS